MIEIMCRSCGNTFPQYNSLQRKCGRCSYNLNAKPKKPMKRLGKVGKQWLADRAKWVKENPPNHQGYYTCYLCGGQVHLDEMALDHKKSRGRHPELRSDQSNLYPTHHACNNEKGSKDA